MSKKLQVGTGIMPGFDMIGKKNVVEPDGKVVIATIWRHKTSKAVVLQFSGNRYEGLDGDYTMDSDNRLFDGDNSEILHYGMVFIFFILHDLLCACICVAILTVDCTELEDGQKARGEDAGIVFLSAFCTHSFHTASLMFRMRWFMNGCTQKGLVM